MWVNELGGVTFEIGAGDRRRFVKWAPAGSGLDLAAEAARLAWAVAFTPVPRPLGQGADRTGSWLVTSALPGEMAITARWNAEPHTAVAAIGAGLRAMHEALPVRRLPVLLECRRDGSPMPAGGPRGASWTRPGGIPAIRRSPSPRRWSCSPTPRRWTSWSSATATAAHRTRCSTADGRCSGHVDLGELGVADRWADLAVATWSTTWNYGPGWEPQLLDAYGIAPDPGRTSYYRLLWDLGP